MIQASVSIGALSETTFAMLLKAQNMYYTCLIKPVETPYPGAFSDFLTKGA